jgi:hypothetical protein
VTPEELQLLKAISEKDLSTFVPAGQGAAQAQRFDRLVETLQTLERLGWIELQVTLRRTARVTQRSKYVGAAARCTEQGRRVLVYLGEGGVGEDGG